MSLQHSVAGSSLADILERILDKGIVVAGDVSISLVGVELLTIRLRLVVASVDRAMQMGIRWWEAEAALGGTASEATKRLESENAALAARLAKLEALVAASPAARLSPG